MSKSHIFPVTIQQVAYTDTQELSELYVEQEGLADLINIFKTNSEIIIITEDTTSEQDATIQALVENYKESISSRITLNYVESAVSDAMSFGRNLLIKFAAENTVLGITELNMTSHVRVVTSSVVSALMVGAVSDAIDQVRLIAEEDKDDVFLTDVRLLKYINLCEDYLQIPRSLSL
jgi:hypothetical protein